MTGKTSKVMATPDWPSYLAQTADSDVNVGLEALVMFEKAFKRHSDEVEIFRKIDQVL